MLFASTLTATQCLEELEGSLARVIDVDASLSDIKATIAWDATTDLPATVTLEVWNDSGGLVASAVVSPTAGEMTVEWIPGALSQLTTHGLAYSIAAPGVLSAPYHFVVGFDCAPGPADCSLELTGDLETSAVFIDSALATELDSIALSGSPDTLAQVLGDYPRADRRGCSARLAARRAGSETGPPHRLLLRPVERLDEPHPRRPPLR